MSISGNGPPTISREQADAGEPTAPLSWEITPHRNAAGTLEWYELADALKERARREPGLLARWGKSAEDDARARKRVFPLQPVADHFRGAAERHPDAEPFVAAAQDLQEALAALTTLQEGVVDQEAADTVESAILVAGGQMRLFALLLGNHPRLQQDEDDLGEALAALIEAKMEMGLHSDLGVVGEDG